MNVGDKVSLKRTLRDHEGRTHPVGAKVTLLRTINNIDRIMHLVQFDDASTTFVFPDEIEE